MINSNQISVSWVTPQSIIDQGVSQYHIVVTPLCSAASTVTTQGFTATPSDPSSIAISTLGNLNTNIMYIVDISVTNRCINVVSSASECYCLYIHC